MNILDHQEVLEHEVKLLNESGENLSSFYLYSPQESIFIPPPIIVRSLLRKQYRIDSSELKTCLNHTNTSLQIFTCLLMKIYYENPQQLQLLEHLKCTLYSSDVQIDEIVNMPKRNLSSNIMKKILVQFFQIMQYHQGKVELMLDKYPIVVEIFILFFRTILNKMHIQGANNFRSNIDSNQTISTLLDYFDIHYQTRKNLYVIADGQLFLYVDSQSNALVYGEKDQTSTNIEKESEESQQKYENQFNFGSIGESQVFENFQSSNKDFAPTPHFMDLKEQDVNFQNKNKKRKYSKDYQLGQEEEIRETTQLEECQEESLRRSSHEENLRSNVQSPKLREDGIQVYFDEEEKYPNSQQLLEGIQSPNTSSPSTEMIDMRQIKMIQKRAQRRSSNNPINIGDSLISDKNDNKSDIFPIEKKKSPNNFQHKNEDDASIYSCSCSQSRMKKNILQSNVVDINFKKDFSKKSPYTPESKPHDQEFGAKTIKTEVRKAPQFLIKKMNSATLDSGQKYNNILENSLAFSKKSGDGRPKVHFTYQQNLQKTPIITPMKNQHVYTEPSYLSQMRSTKIYYKETPKNNVSQSIQGYPSDPMRKVGTYELQGNPRMYRNYVQQKIRYI